MEYLVGTLVALLGGLLFYRNKAKNSDVEAKLANTKGQDQVLKIREEEIEEAIKSIDEGISKMKADKLAEKQRRDNLTLKERAEEAKNRYKK